MADSVSTAQGGEARREGPAWLEKLKAYPDRAKAFLHEVRVEMRGVTWPSRAETTSTTVVVVLTTAFFALFLWLVDMGANRLIGYILKELRR